MMNCNQTSVANVAVCHGGVVCVGVCGLDAPTCAGAYKHRADSARLDYYFLSPSSIAVLYIYKVRKTTNPRKKIFLGLCHSIRKLIPTT